MSGLKWIDRVGTCHLLDHYQFIVDEIGVLESEIDAQLPGLESPDRAVRDRARQIVENRHHRLVELQADLVRWNGYAEEETRKAAADMLGQIAQLSAALKDMRLLVGLHDEHAQLLHDSRHAPEQREAALAASATSRQVLAIALVESATKPDDPTRGEAWEWLSDQPRFQRSLTSDGGWFAWVDPDGHAHRLVDPFAIERMMITCLVQLEAMRADLAMQNPSDALFITVERAFALMNKVNDIKQDLERFDREAAARDLAACRSFVADWRARKTL